MRLIRLSIIAAAALLYSLLFSQSSSQIENRKYDLSIFFINYQASQNTAMKTVGINLNYISNGELRRIGAKVGQLTRDFTYTGQSNFSFIEEIMDAEGEVSYTPLVNAELGTNGRKLILLIRDPSGRLITKVFDLGASKFSKNTVRCINIARSQIRAKIGSRIKDLVPMNSVDFKVSGDKRKYLVPFILATVDQEAQPVVLEKGRLSIRNEERILILFYHDPRNLSRIRYKRITLTDEPIFEDTSDDEVEETEADNDAARKAEKEEAR